MTDEKTPTEPEEKEETLSVELTKDDLVDEIPKPKTEKITPDDTLKQVAAILKNDGVQMILSGIATKYLSAPPIATAAVQQTPDEKLNGVMNVLGYLQSTLSPKATIKDSIVWIGKNSEEFKKVL